MSRIARSLMKVGDNLLGPSSSALSLQIAHPWFNDKSNTCLDNKRTLQALFADRTVVLFMVPAPFTGTCTNAHVPSFAKLTSDFKAKGVDEVVCCAVSDPYAHFNWAEKMGVQDKMSFLADWDGSFSEEFDLLKNYDAEPGCGLGKRAKRVSMVVVNGEVKAFNVVTDAANDGSVCLEAC